MGIVYDILVKYFKKISIKNKIWKIKNYLLRRLEEFEKCLNMCIVICCVYVIILEIDIFLFFKVISNVINWFNIEGDFGGEFFL